MVGKRRARHPGRCGPVVVHEAGDHVELEAEIDALAVISNCAQIHNPVNGFNPTPVRVLVFRR